MSRSSSPLHESESSRQIGKHGSACDACRRRKLKCNTLQPCDRCLKSDISCSYGRATSRMNTVSYVRNLEQQIITLQGLLEQHTFGISDESSRESNAVGENPNSTRLLEMRVGRDFIYRIPGTHSNTFHGRFSGLSMLRSVGEMCTTYAGMDTEDFLTSALLPETFDVNEPMEQNGHKLLTVLPPMDKAFHLLRYTFDDALMGHDCIDREDFFDRLVQLYNTDTEDYIQDDRNFLALLYASLALGKRYENRHTDAVNFDAQNVDHTGSNYFRASNEVLNFMEVNNLDSIRAVIVQAIYLCSQQRLSQAYGRIGTGAAAAQRMGLHVASAQTDILYSDMEKYNRRRVMAVLNMIDTYVASMLGLPKTLQYVVEEQTIGVHQNDLEDLGQSFVERFPIASASESILTQKLFNILARLHESRIRRQGTQAEGSQIYHVRYEEIARCEGWIEAWHNNLPTVDMTSANPRDVRAQLHLRYGYSVLQFILYRPYLHYLAPDGKTPEWNMQGYECGSACVRAAMQLIWHAHILSENGTLNDANWFHIFTLSEAAQAITFFALCNQHGPTVEECMASAMKAQELLGDLARNNASAKQCYDALDSLLQVAQRDHVSGDPHLQDPFDPLIDTPTC